MELSPLVTLATKIYDAIKLSPKKMFSWWILSLIAINMPLSWWGFIHIKDPSRFWLPFFGISFLVSSAFLATNILWAIGGKIRDTYYVIKENARRELIYRSLTPYELSRINKFLTSKQEVLYFDDHDPIVIGLVEKDVVTWTTSKAQSDKGFPMKLTSNYKSYLNRQQRKPRTTQLATQHQKGTKKT